MSFQLRPRTRISYCEYEEPNLDEYIFCEKCSDYVYEYCSIHGPLLVVPDDQVPARTGMPAFVPRAALTIPKVFLHLAPSIIPGAGLGVFSTLTLPRGVRFGPYRGQHTNKIQSTYCWQLHDGNNKWSHVIDAADANNSNWMRYVNCSRHWCEQNLVAYQYQGQIYYRTIKIIPRFTELMVFYGSEFAHHLNINLKLYNRPSGYAQNFGAKLSKKRKLTNEQDKGNQLDSPTASTTTEETTGIRNEAQNMEPKRITEYENKDSLSKPTIFPKNSDENNNVVKNKHNQVKYHTEKLTCDICKNEFFCKRNLESHITKFHTEISVIANHNCTNTNENCNDNKTKLKSKIGSVTRSHRGHSINKRDIKTDIKEKHYKCNVCNKRFTTNSDLSKHQRIHTGEKPYICNVCDKRFTQHCNLSTHQRIHTGEKPYICNVCDKRFTRHCNLSTHQRIHTGEKPYICNVCYKRFTQHCNLSTHQRIHTGEKPYKCNVCDKRFTDSGHLNRHRRIHTGEKPYICNVCDKRFTISSNLSKHKRIHTGNFKLINVPR